ncbi:glycosyltransferase family 2 protein [Mucilaginibacter corticis]|uniref:Glycosyltransferase family 2 protein n=1 Tax=Mucilaginibacter corticis TaxID=2597670 RepID=A0A556M8Z7_9SPHI|nr:glycosyltransferase family 2 protein [Mucilaginibacter corticis]TSJ36398.1 glycosyltransferase family 2 protein [Mucilaginibacter corticis]
MNDEPLILILMASYNGEKYIEAQLDSVINQTFRNWRLLIRDDGSTDLTLEIVKKYLKKNGKINLAINEGEEHGSVANFAALFDLARKDLEAAYFMFCDQDDVWLPEKIEASLNQLQKMEDAHPNAPVLVYGSLQMISENGEEINQAIKLRPQLGFKQTLVQNFAFGCTMMFNKSLLDLVRVIPRTSVNHDHWVALFTSAFGYSGFITEPMIKYRQHQQNVTSQGSSFQKRYGRFTKGLNDQLLNYKRQMTMLIQFNQNFGAQLKNNDKQLLTEYLNGYYKGRWAMLYQILKHKIFKLTFFQNVGMVYMIVFFYAQFKQIESDMLNQ